MGGSPEQMGGAENKEAPPLLAEIGELHKGIEEAGQEVIKHGDGVVDQAKNMFSSISTTVVQTGMLETKKDSNQQV